MMQLDKKDVSLSQLGSKLIRHVLMTDPSQFDTLTLSDTPRSTPTLKEFEKDYLENATSMEGMMKRAFRDQLVAQKSIQQLQELVLSLHEQLRSLVPNRPDLHGSVDDEAVKLTNTVESLFPLLIRASQGLQLLESEARAETTLAWQKLAQQTRPTYEFAVTSTLYLLYKAELCQADKQDFYLQHVWAPRIHVEGPMYLRTQIHEQFASNGLPLTKLWIKEIVEASSDSTVKDLKNSSDARRTRLRKHYVESILFRKDQAVAVPEILALEVDTIQLIRKVCRRAVAGCALSLHASSAAGIGTNVLSERIEATSVVGLRKADLVQKLSNNLSPSFEEDIAQAVVALGKAWSQSSSINDESSLRNRTISVLRGQDPVIQLMDRRMQDTFVDILTANERSAPPVMRSGVQGSAETNSISTDVAYAEKAFYQKGLSFYAEELAKLAILAKKSIDLVWVVHHEFIETTLVETLKGV